MDNKNYSWAVRGYEKDNPPPKVPLLELIPEGDDPDGAKEAALEAATGFLRAGATDVTVERVES